MSDSSQADLPLVGKIARLRRRRVTALIAILLVLAPMIFLAVRVEGLQIRVSPASVAPVAEVTRSGGFAVQAGARWFLLGQSLVLEIVAEGYREQTVTLSRPITRRFVDVKLEPLPGQLVVTVAAPKPYELRVNDQPQRSEDGYTYIITAASGDIELALIGPNFESVRKTVTVTGLGKTQTIELAAKAATGRVTFKLEPPDARIGLDGHPVERFDGSLPLALGTHEITISKDGYYPVTKTIAITPNATVDLGLIKLKPVMARISLSSEPTGASVFIGTVFKGTTPFELRLPAGQSVRLTIRKSGYEKIETGLVAPMNGSASRRFELSIKSISGTITAAPPADIAVNGVFAGKTPVVRRFKDGDLVTATAANHAEARIRISANLSEGFQHHFDLLPASEAPFARAPDQETAPSGIELRRFAGRLIRSADLAKAGMGQRFQDDMSVKPFYLGVAEVTEAQFQQIVGRSESGLVNADLPVRDITWEQAAEFCNRLSAEAGLQPFYRFDETRGVRVLLFDTAANGYRLPTELEWLAANLPRQTADSVTGAVLYSWGASSLVPRGIGNLGGSEAQAINAGSFVPNYRDDHIELAAVRSYRPNWAGIHDLDGNVSEWLHDFRHAPSGSIQDGAFGPSFGSSHIVRGSHFRSTSLEDLNLARRTHSSRADALIGFRIARSIL